MSDWPAAYAGRRVLVTGHTGFKGAWLVLWLKELGAEVAGFSLPPPTEPSLYAEANVGELLAAEALADVRDATRLVALTQSFRPEIVFHLAAQSLVRRSYREPRTTWETNVLGTVNLLEAVRAMPSVRVCQVITSDKCYENAGRGTAFRETDAMGGHDPYSSSKGAAELAVAAWRRSYFVDGPSLSSARAGNVIGGGDWAEDRILPDCVRALERGEPIAVRNPAAVRPWQHVLEPLSGYLLLAARQLDDPTRSADAYNFGPPPSGHLTVGEVADIVVKEWGDGRWEHRPSPDEAGGHEAALLQLDITKATTELGWTPRFTPAEAIAEAVAWYRARHQQGPAFDARAACREQIRYYRDRHQ